jgi:hypothetical protein
MIDKLIEQRKRKNLKRERKHYNKHKERKQQYYV